MDKEDTSSLESEVRSMFGKILRIRVADSRIIEGVFECLDKDMNVVVNNAKEYHSVEDINFTETPNLVRSIGMAIVPGHVIESIVLVIQNQTEDISS